MSIEVIKQLTKQSQTTMDIKWFVKTLRDASVKHAVLGSHGWGHFRPTVVMYRLNDVVYRAEPLKGRLVISEPSSYQVTAHKDYLREKGVLGAG